MGCQLSVGPELVPPRSLFAWTAVFTIATAATSQAAVVVMAVERMRPAAALSTCAGVVAVGASVVLTHAWAIAGAVIGATAALLGVLLPGIVLLAGGTLRALERET